MTHGPRMQGESGFYHVVSKGDGAQIIFEDESDRGDYIGLLASALREHHVELHAYCLMGNHVHLLVRDEKYELSAFMKQVSETYAMHFLKKTGRVGRVFQRPFWSEPVESDEYYLCALRYIHANPEHAGICEAKDYPWSSYQAHSKHSGRSGRSDRSEHTAFVEVEFARELLGGVRQFEEFSTSGAKFATPFPNSKLHRHLEPDELSRIALNVLGRDVLNYLRTMPPKERRAHLAKLRASGFTENELVRITGIGKGSIHKALLKS